MKLGTETGSLTNHILSRAVVGQPDPVVGMGATVLCWTDRHAATIIRVEDKILTVREDRVRRTDKNGMSETQTWEYEPNPDGRIYLFRQARNDAWEEVCVNAKTGRLNKTGGPGLRIGERDEYHDFSF